MRERLSWYRGRVQPLSECTDAGRNRLRGPWIQDPARDNIKIAGTWIEALERNDAREPGEAGNHGTGRIGGRYACGQVAFPL